MQALDKKGSLIYLSTKKRRRREEKIKKKIVFSEAYVAHPLFPFLYTFFSSPPIFRNGALFGVAGLTDWHVLLRISLNIGITILL